MQNNLYNNNRLTLTLTLTLTGAVVIGAGIMICARFFAIEKYYLSKWPANKVEIGKGAYSH